MSDGSPPGGDVTQLLQRWSTGDRNALDDLIPLVYVELRKIAEGYFARERSTHTLQPTALIHEAWMRMGICHASISDIRVFPGNVPALITFNETGHMPPHLITA